MDKLFAAASALNAVGCYSSAIGYCQECKLPREQQRGHVKNSYSMLGIANATLAVTSSAFGAVWRDLDK